jgi:PAS domain S-box-containing protein
MAYRKPYPAPSVTQHGFGNEYLAWITRSLESPTEEQGRFRQRGAESDYVTVVNHDREFVEVSDNFCQLVGYEREELLGKQYDELTAPNTYDIEKFARLFAKLGYMHGLWLLVSRGGTRILIRYDAWVRPDSLIETHMELVGAGY